MDLLALGTPVIDLFAKVSDSDIKRLKLKKGATNFFTARELAAIENGLGKKITYKYPGDNARNVCEGFAALGGFCGFAGAIGSDKAGAHFAANLAECGVSDFLQERKGATGKILCLVTPDRQRTFCADLGVSTNCGKMERIAVKNSRMFYAASIVLVGKPPASKLAAKYMQEFKRQKKKVALSIENPPMVLHHRAFLLSAIHKYVDYLFLNEDEAEALLGRGAEGKLLLLKPRIPIYLKKGEHGSALFLNCQRHTIPALPARAIDSTGAGDAYCAGTLYGITRGYSPLSSAKIGCYIATKVVEKFGAGVPLRHTRLVLRHGKAKR